jgi:hypothetical protein
VALVVRFAVVVFPAELFALELFAVELFVEDFDDDGLDAELFAEDDFDAVALLEELFFPLLLAEVFDFDDDALLRAARLRAALLARALRVGRFQPTALSARKVRGIETMLSGLSIIAAAAASARSARTSAITFAGRRARAACTRFVSRSTNISRSGSIQIDVPVNPV